MSFKSTPHRITAPIRDFRPFQGSRPAFIRTVVMSADYYHFERRALSVLRRHPGALQDWLTEFREVQRRQLIEANDAE